MSQTREVINVAIDTCVSVAQIDAFRFTKMFSYLNCDNGSFSVFPEHTLTAIVIPLD